MKVAHINATYGTGGVSGTEQSVPNTCSLLEARGIATCVLYDRSTGPEPSAPERKTFQVPGVASRSATRQATERALEFLRAEDVDVVHIHQVNNVGLVRKIKQRWPVFLFIHNHILTCPSGLREFRRPWRECPQPGPAASCVSNAYLRRCNSRRPNVILEGMRTCIEMRSAARETLIGVDSEYMKGTLVRSGFGEEQIVVTATVTEDVAEPPPAYPTVTPRSILHVSALIEIKGTEHLLRAFANVRAPTRLTVAGDGYYRPKLTRLVARLGISNRVEFVGPVGRPELFALLRQSSILSVPSRYPEPFGLVGPEAMSMARPVVGFDVGGIPEWLRDGETGYLVPAEDVGAMAERLRALIEDPELGRRMGLAGRRVWEREFQPLRHIDQLVGVYKRLLATGSPSPAGA